jgi:CelD/BcsL family acetyltransferase involved in cellulose biosynthesis
MRELGREDFDAWAALQDADPALASPFFCPEYAAAVARVREDVQVAIIERDGERVGFFPFQKAAFSAGHPVGGPLSDCHGFIMRRGLDWEPRRIVRACGLAEWRFDHLPVAQAPCAPHHRGVAHSPVMDLSRGYERYAADRRAAGSEQIPKTAGLLRKLEREHGPVRFEFHAPDARSLQTLVSWKSAQYRACGKLDIFGIPWVAKVVETMHATRGPNFAGVLSALWLGERLIAAHMGLRSKTVWHYWFPAYDPAYARYSPGLILLLKMAEHAASEGLATIDLGLGRALYKQRLMSGSIALAEGSVIASPVRAALADLRARSEGWLRRSPLFESARRVRRVLSEIGGRLPILQRLKNIRRFR